ncbi:MAG: DJ-1/PfpI family protein [Clostridia bacterium]|nr:DJ-1/PfpI family protein [Clostridia bacterium]
MNIGFGLGVLFTYQDYITRTDALIVLMLSFILGIFILSWIFIRPLIKKIMKKRNQKKKIAMVIAAREFRDEECFETKDILEKEGFNITLFSNEKGIAVGRFGGEIKVEKTLEEIKVSDFNCILFVGGGGAIRYLDNNLSYNLLRKANNENIVIAAICIAPVILANAGVLEGKKATVWSSDLDKSAIKILEQKGATYINKNSVIDKNIVTANGPSAIKEFCEDIIRFFRENDSKHE